MNENEFRVRPVTRYNLTHYQSATDAEGRSSGSCTTLGEFSSLEAAERVGAAMHQITEGSTFVTIDKGGQIGGPRADQYIGSIQQANGGKPYRLTRSGWEEIK